MVQIRALIICTECTLRYEIYRKYLCLQQKTSWGCVATFNKTLGACTSYYKRPLSEALPQRRYPRSTTAENKEQNKIIQFAAAE